MNYRIMEEEDYSGKTVLFTEEELAKAKKALEKSNIFTYSALYKRDDVFIWQLTFGAPEVYLSRLTDFGREKKLSKAKDYLNTYFVRCDFEDI